MSKETAFITVILTYEVAAGDPSPADVMDLLAWELGVGNLSQSEVLDPRSVGWVSVKQAATP